MKLVCLVLVLGCSPLAVMASTDNAAVGTESKKSGDSPADKYRSTKRGVPPENGSQKAVAAAAEQVLDTTCVDGDPFTLEGYFDGSLDGCYSVLAENNGTTLPWYGLDGEADDDSSIVILPVSLSGGDFIWAIIDFRLATPTYPYFFYTVCYDTDANDVVTMQHPSEVTSWTCADAVTLSISTTDAPLSITCGCGDNVTTTSSAPASVVGGFQLASSLIVPLVVLTLFASIF